MRSIRRRPTARRSAHGWISANRTPSIRRYSTISSNTRLTTGKYAAMMAERPGLTTPASVTALENGSRREFVDDLATEEPLAIRLSAGGETRSLAITMRTPSNDFELAAGFLFSEGIINERDDIRSIAYCIDPAIDAGQRYNIVTVELASGMPALERLERHFTVNSACGVCGKASIETLQLRAEALHDDTRVSA